jgi:4-hydroxy-tetrahydrodipicolinate reductase
MKIFVVGAGKLATFLLSNLSPDNCEVLQWRDEIKSSGEKAVVIHAGSGRQLKDCIDFCSSTKSVLVELSTGLKTEDIIPDFPIIICPNTSILVLKTLNLLKIHGRELEKYTISITESHQAKKTTEPGTAYAIANSLNFPTVNIQSVRVPDVQSDIIGIPKEYLEKHAYHKIVFKDGLDEVTIETKVLGYESYLKGVRSILEAVTEYPLDHKRYTILDLMDLKLIC